MTALFESAITRNLRQMQLAAAVNRTRLERSEILSLTYFYIKSTDEDPCILLSKRLTLQMFFQFDTILLLSGGKVAYYGSPEDVLRQFQEMGFSCDSTHYNPADFIREFSRKNRF